MKEDAIEMFIKNRIILDLPILDKNFKLIKTINRNDILDVEELNSEKYNLKDIPVVVMAGGKGKRLRSFHQGASKTTLYLMAINQLF